MGLNIEIIEGCNNKCFFCKAKDVKKTKYMSKELFNFIIDECNRINIKDIDLIPSKGEIFLHPNIYSFLKKLDENNFNYLIFTNLLNVNIKKLNELKLKKLILNISHYGNNEDEYIYHTNTNKKQYFKYLTKLDQLKKSNINYYLNMRTESTYNFQYDGGPEIKIPPFNGKCNFIFHPKIEVDGKITYCKFINSNINEPIYFDKINLQSDIYDILSSSKRYYFFNNENYCKNYCTNYLDNCSYKLKIIDIKLYNNSKLQNKR